MTLPTCATPDPSDHPVPGFADAVCQAYQAASPVQRVQLLERLLPHLRPLALATIGAGVFSHLITRARWSQVQLTVDQLSRIDVDKVISVASYVEQSSPGLLAQLCTALSEDFSATPAMAAIFLTMALRGLRARRDRPPP